MADLYVLLDFNVVIDYNSSSTSRTNQTQRRKTWYTYKMYLRERPDVFNRGFIREIQICNYQEDILFTPKNIRIKEWIHINIFQVQPIFMYTGSDLTLVQNISFSWTTVALEQEKSILYYHPPKKIFIHNGKREL